MASQELLGRAIYGAIGSTITDIVEMDELSLTRKPVWLACRDHGRGAFGNSNRHRAAR